MGHADLQHFIRAVCTRAAAVAALGILLFIHKSFYVSISSLTPSDTIVGGIQ